METISNSSFNKSKYTGKMTQFKLAVAAWLYSGKQLILKWWLNPEQKPRKIFVFSEKEIIKLNS